MLKRRLLTTVLAGSLLLSFPAIALADLSSLGNAGVSGSVKVLGQTTDKHRLNITVDYAVFAPGEFTGVFEALNGSLGAGDYIYAYQIHSNGPQSGVSDYSTAGLSKMGIDLAGGTVSAIGYESSPSSLLEPAIATFSDTHFLFVFPTASDQTRRLEPDQSSAVLLVSSPHSWGFADMSILNGGLSVTAKLPSPASSPAPSAVLLIVVGMGVVSAMKTRFLGRLRRVD